MCFEHENIYSELEWGHFDDKTITFEWMVGRERTYKRVYISDIDKNLKVKRRLVIKI